MEKPWTIRDADGDLYRLCIRRATKGLPFADQKNPARAYLFSLLVWGAGQGYAGQRKESVLYQTFMLLFLMGLVLSLLYGPELLALLGEYGVSRSGAFLAGNLLVLSALLFWAFNAADAYHAAANTRRIPFHGIENRLLPMLASLLFPGWGQFMNGQPSKGALLSAGAAFGIFSIGTIAAVLQWWPWIESDGTRVVIETIFSLCVLYAPLTPLLWLLGGYDALMVSLDDTKKESLLDRIALAAGRFRSDGWLRAVVSPAKALVLIALLFVSLAAAIDRYQPVHYYSTHLEAARIRLAGQGMTLVPGMISRLVPAENAAGNEETPLIGMDAGAPVPAAANIMPEEPNK